MAAIVPMLGRRGASPSPERAALADAIAKRDERARLLEGIRAQAEAADTAYYAAVTKRDEAATVAAGAAAAYGAHLVNVQAGAVDEAPITPQRARQLLADAEDELETARAVRSSVKVRAVEQESAVSLAHLTVSNAASAVLAQSPAIRATVAAFERAQVDLLRLGVSLQWLVDGGFVSAVHFTLAPGDREAGKAALKPVIERTLVDRLCAPPMTWRALLDGPAGIQATGAAPWSAALDALMKNPDAPLPAEAGPVSAA